MAASSVHGSSNWEDGQVKDVWREMLRMTLDIVGKTLFSADVESKDDEVGQAMKAATLQYRAFKLPLAKLFERLPLPQIRRFHRGKQRLRELVLEIIEQRRSEGRDYGDLLSMLLMAEEEGEPNSRMTAEQVWDEALTIFIAGYDTMATALMWTWYLLAKNPEVETKLHAELDEVLSDGRPASFNDFPQLQYTERVLTESMRVYPPTWRLVRRAITDFSLGEYVVPNGAMVVMSQFAMHRDPRFFPDPERFDPERWTPEARSARPAYSYFPFGGGPRRCLGEGFAIMEGVLVLATLARRWRMHLVPEQRIEIYPDHLLRSRNGMMMRLEQRR
jgi:cytochrome P450